MKLLHIVLIGVAVAVFVSARRDGKPNAREMGRMASELKTVSEQGWAEFQQGYQEAKRE
ncbi:MAG TPA: hypothetical protein VMY42_03935 [Thermoguttaceae bacterium]|nr:hypothetical protein [Thermoguttaceae bacterium]